MYKKPLFIIPVITLAAISIWAFTNRTAEQLVSTQPLKMIVVRDLGDVNLVQEIATKKGFFEKNGVPVEPVVLEKISDTRNVNTVLLSGEADVLMTGIMGEFAVYLNNADVRWIAQTFTPFSFFAVSRFERNDFNSIRTVGVIRFGGEPALITDAVLSAMHLDPANVKLVAIPTNAARKELLDKGDLDLIIVNSEQFIYESKLDTRYTVVSPEELFAGSSLYRGIMTTGKVLQENPEAVKRFVASIYQSMEYIKANPEEVKQYMREAYRYSDEQASQSYGRFIAAYTGVNFVPSISLLENTLATIKDKFKPTNPERGLGEFIYEAFARDAVTAGVK